MDGAVVTGISTLGGVVVALITVGLPILAKSKKDTPQILDAISGVSKDVANNSRLTVATARANLESIYHRYKTKKAMPEKTWLLVCELHQAYKAVQIDGHVPNSWADSLYKEMETWKKL